jgi:general secretion pathway protein K
VREERGFALVITLIISALLVALVTEFIHEVYVETSLARSYADAQQASLLADSGVTGGARLLQTVLSSQEYSSLLDQWAAPLEMEDERGSLRVEITEENGKLNLNSFLKPDGTPADAYDMAVRLFTALKLPSDLCVTLADWIDTNDEQRPGGAETSYYSSLPTLYRAKNAPLDTLDELRMVKGFDDKTLKILSPFVTVYGDAGPAGTASNLVNINTAPVEVLTVLDDQMTDTLAKRIVEYRKTKPIKIPAEVTGIPGLETIGQSLIGKIVVKGKIYRIYSRAQVNETIRIVEAVVRIDGQQSSVLYWREL